MMTLFRIRPMAALIASCMITAPVTAADQQDAAAIGADLAAGEDAAQIASAMPSLDPPASDLPEIAAQTAQQPVRMIADPVVQDVPPSPPALSGDPFVIKSILPIVGTIRYGEWYWDENRAPENGKLVVTVDLDARVVSVFRDGHEIGTAVALLGTQKHPTPLGAFPILTKEKDNISEKYDNAPMPWTLRLTWDGIAIHGSPVLNGYASHGCIGVPDAFAEKLFAIAKRGDKVVITRGQMIGLGDKIIG
ncbi:L,D-transpeptidase family protein [Erythrobacter sp. MTPC3]|uniref:L,D-transpeptidase family protein n=1 Tax=Erythrobacter sp. MTPC3 TaxID=3056564 RepID=UPI0036F39619